MGGGDEGTERGQERGGKKKAKLDGTGRTEHGKTGRRRDETDTEDRDRQDEETDRKDKRGQKRDEDTQSDPPLVSFARGRLGVKKKKPERTLSDVRASLSTCLTCLSDCLSDCLRDRGAHGR